MYIKFLKTFYTVNLDVQWAINNNRSYFDSLPLEEGEPRFFDGADALSLSGEFIQKTAEGQVLKISAYNYDESTHILDFKLYHKCTNNEICTDLIDITNRRIWSISKDEFEILED